MNIEIKDSKKKTNFDRIMSMNREDFIRFLRLTSGGYATLPIIEGKRFNHWDEVREWLDEEVDDGTNYR